jgi:hypothetical protein
VPSPDDPLEAGDELLFVASPEQEDALHDVLAAQPVPAGSAEDSALEPVVESALRED